MLQWSVFQDSYTLNEQIKTHNNNNSIDNNNTMWEVYKLYAKFVNATNLAESKWTVTMFHVIFL